MKSGKQRKLEIKAARLRRVARHHGELACLPTRLLAGVVACETGRLASSNSYGAPAFVYRGYYIDATFRCKDCGAEGIWTAARQKWWYEVAQGNVETRAVRCSVCRTKERERKALARQNHQAGLLAKQTRAVQ